MARRVPWLSRAVGRAHGMLPSRFRRLHALVECATLPACRNLEGVQVRLEEREGVRVQPHEESVAGAGGRGDVAAGDDPPLTVSAGMALQKLVDAAHVGRMLVSARVLEVLPPEYAWKSIADA